MMRYFIDTDNDSHWFVIPFPLEAEWNAWLDISPDDERSWEAPEWARPINGDPSLVTFTDPKHRDNE